MQTTTREGAPARGGALIRWATGQREHRDGQDWLVYERRIHCSAEELWAAWTEPEVLARWVGRSEQGKLDGPSDFYFTFEGDDLLPMTYTLEHVEAGRSIGVSTKNPGDEHAWRLEIDLLHDADVMVLRVAQAVANAAVAPSIATGWEYYLDRLVALLEGGTVSDLDYDEYFLGQAEHYRGMFPVQPGRTVV